MQGIQDYVGVVTQLLVIGAKGCDIVDATWPESEIIETPLTDREQSDNNAMLLTGSPKDRDIVIIAVVGEGVDQVGESLIPYRIEPSRKAIKIDTGFTSYRQTRGYGDDKRPAA